MSASATGTPLINNTTAASAAGDASLSTPLFEGIVRASKKGHILTEDRALVITNGTNSVHAVFDGHGGITGVAFAEVACFVTKRFFESINWAETTPTDLKKLMLNLFRRIDDYCAIEAGNEYPEDDRTRAFLKQIQVLSGNTGSYDPTRGGTTGTIVVVSFCPLTHRRYVLTAHVGDSSAALVCGDVATQLDAGNHGIDNLLEEERIEADFQHRRNLAIAVGSPLYSVRRVSLTYSGGSQAFVQQNGVTIPNPQVAINKWGQGRQPCNVNDDLSGYVILDGDKLAMTRALADFKYRNAGVIALPTVSVMYLDPEQTGQLVVASDGLWDAVFLTREQKMASRYPKFMCLSEMLAASESIEKFRTLALGQVLSAFDSDYDDVTVVVGILPSHAECLAAHLAAVPESRAERSGVPYGELLVYDCYKNHPDYYTNIEEQFPAPVEEVEEVAAVEFRPNWAIREPDAVAVPVEAPVRTVADIIGPLMEEAKRDRSNCYGKAPRMYALLRQECRKYGALYRVNQPRK